MIESWSAVERIHVATARFEAELGPGWRQPTDRGVLQEELDELNRHQVGAIDLVDAP